MTETPATTTHGTRKGFAERFGLTGATRTLAKGVVLVLLGTMFLANVLTLELLVGVGLIVWGLLTLVADA